MNSILTFHPAFDERQGHQYWTSKMSECAMLGNVGEVHMQASNILLNYLNDSYFEARRWNKNFAVQVYDQTFAPCIMNMQRKHANG